MQPPDYVVRIVIILLASVIGAQILAVAGRGFGCLYFNERCSAEDFKSALETFQGMTATIIALLFALLKK